MTAADNEITDTLEIAETEWGGYSEPGDVETEMTATKAATGDRMEFHVQMRGYTLSDMEELIVTAAAKQIVGGHNDREMAKLIEAKCIEQISAKADAKLAEVTAEIIDQPMVPNWSDKKPLTMREFLGLYGREYLAERVDLEGKPYTSGGWGSSNTYSRMEWLVMKVMDRKFKAEMEAATNAAIREIQGAVKKAHESILEEQKARLRDALGKAVS